MICVLGEVMLDKYTYGKVERINPEAPVPILHVVNEKYTLGGAGNVANNLVSLNENVYLLSLCNEKETYGSYITNICKKNGIKYYFITDGRPTIVKHRFVALGYNQQLLRVDYEEKHPLNCKYSEMLINKILELNPKILIISDYAKGMITADFMNKLKKRFKGKLLVDPKPNNINLYKNAFLIKPNLKEASEIVGRTIENNDKDVEDAGIEIVNKYESNVVITRSEKGSTLITLDNDIYHIPTNVREIHDVSGAGDTYIATLGYALNNNYNLVDAVKLANRASSIVVGKIGTATINLKELFNSTCK